MDFVDFGIGYAAGSSDCNCNCNCDDGGGGSIFAEIALIPPTLKVFIVLSIIIAYYFTDDITSYFDIGFVDYFTDDITSSDNYVSPFLPLVEKIMIFYIILFMGAIMFVLFHIIKISIEISINERNEYRSRKKRDGIL